MRETQIRFHCKLLSIVVLPAIFFTGCGTAVTYVSHPPGAIITEIGSGTKIGTAPTTKRYNLDIDGAVDESGCFVIENVEARWVSGATRETTQIKLCGNHPLGYKVELPRPSSHADLGKDEKAAKDLRFYRYKLFSVTQN